MLDDDPSPNEMYARPRASVVIQCLNGPRYLGEAIDSLLSQTMKDSEVIVVDDGSDGDTAEATQSRISAHPEAVIHLLRHTYSQDQTRARNAGVARARGEYVVCLDGDDRLAPEYLERCVAALDARPDVAIAYTDERQFGAASTLRVAPEYDFRALTRQNLCGAASLFRLRAWEDAGGFDPDSGYDDWDFWIGCGERGDYGVKVPGAEWLHRVRANRRLVGDDSDRSDRLVKARMVRKRPGLYTERQRRWAEAVLTDDPEADNVRDTVGVIPDADQGVRAFVTVASAQEAIENSRLLEAYGAQFGPDDDATLVLYVPDGGLDDMLARVVRAVEATGFDGADGPAIQVLAVNAAEGDAALLRTATAVLSDVGLSGPLARLPRFRSASVAGLRATAQRVWQHADRAGVVAVGTDRLGDPRGRAIESRYRPRA